MTPPALSVVIPSVGRHSVRETVGSVLASAERARAPVEVIVAWQADRPATLPDGVRVVPAGPGGVAVARNAGLAAARAPLVAFADDDEVVEPGWVAAVLSALAETEAAFGQVLPLDDRGEPFCSMRVDAAEIVRGRRMPPWDVGTGGNMAFRTAALRRLGGFDARFGGRTPGEDTDVIARLQARGATIARAPDMVVRHPSKTPAEILGSRRPYGRGMGAVARRHRSCRLAAQFAIGCFWAVWSIVREPRVAKVRRLAATLRGWAEGVLDP